METIAKKRVLFVDDEQAVLLMLQAFMRRMGAEWECEIAENGPRALELIEQKPFDIVVSDMRMPEMSGAELLNEIMRRSPRTARIVLSGQADEHDVIECIGVTHQWLAKPCDLRVLKSILVRIATFQRRLESQEIQVLVGQVRKLPSAPTIYNQILHALQSSTSSTQIIGDIIAQDPSLVAKILHLVNSAFFGVARTVSSPAEAVQMLGVSRLRSLALAHHIFSSFDTTIYAQFSLEEFWHHSLRTALMARKIADQEGAEENFVEQAFTAGLLHDIGRLILLANLPAACQDIRDQANIEQLPLYTVEKRVLKATHADVGAYLLSLWGLPLPLVEAVAFHHEPALATERAFSPLTCVHVAAVWSQGTTAMSGDTVATPLDLEYLHEINLGERLPAWERKARAA